MNTKAKWLEIEREIRRARMALIPLPAGLRRVGALTAAEALELALECLDREARHAYDQAYPVRGDTPTETGQKEVR